MADGEIANGRGELEKKGNSDNRIARGFSGIFGRGRRPGHLKVR